jgi:hypothetical protein
MPHMYEILFIFPCLTCTYICSTFFSVRTSHVHTYVILLLCPCLTCMKYFFCLDAFHFSFLIFPVCHSAFPLNFSLWNESPFFIEKKPKWYDVIKTRFSQLLKCSICGANPTIVGYNASAVKKYNAASSLVRLKNNNIVFYFQKTL